jgi:UDP-2,3-diacylglucosamine hydrolase
VNTLFISDIHLNGQQPEITEQFLAFLSREARQAEKLYILGDLFEFWIGDDDPDPTYARVQAELKSLTRSGVPCYVMHGNRDFLLGKEFCKRTGCQLLQDGTVIELYGQRILLCHGDVLCTDDVAYQRLRRIVRNPLTQGLLRLLSLKQRQRLACRMRTASQKHTQQTMSSIMDVNQQAVVQYMQNAQVQWLIHGHTHRPHIHQHVLGPDKGTRIVLGDWYQQGSVLSWSDSGYELLSLPR